MVANRSPLKLMGEGSNPPFEQSFSKFLFMMKEAMHNTPTS